MSTKCCCVGQEPAVNVVELSRILAIQAPFSIRLLNKWQFLAAFLGKCHKNVARFFEYFFSPRLSAFST